ncbi:facilitated trehalose transporter Tret1-like [Planococcus citri]|uniref:facilitated trehalose transporter Tret1-like n=1 Tax=Planococcus citri TaxID=170843 RepID=UPI0031F95778
MDKKKLIEETPVPGVAIRRQLLILLPVFVNVFMMGVTGSWPSYALYFFTKTKDVSATMAECAQMVSMAEIGRIISAIPGGILTDKYGRKKINRLTGIIHFTAWVLLSCSTNIMLIYIARLLLGIGTALVNATATTNIGEVASPQIRGSLIGIYLIFFYSGAIFQGMTCAIWSSYKIFTYGNTTIAALYFAVTYWAMETPNFLLSVPKKEKALENLKYIRAGYSEDDINIEYQKMDEYISAEKEQKKQLNWAKFLRSKQIRGPLLITFVLNFLTMMSGINLVGSYNTLIIPDNDYIPKKFYPLIMQCLLFIPTVLTPFYMDMFPRKTLYIVGAGLTGIIQLSNGISYYVFRQYDTLFFKWTFIIGNLMLNAAYGSLLGPTNSAIKSELFPQAVKGLGGSLSIISQATATILSYKLYHIMAAKYLHFLYGLFSISCISLVCFVYFVLPEARGKLLSDLQIDKVKKVKKPSTVQDEFEKHKSENV